MQEPKTLFTAGTLAQYKEESNKENKGQILPGCNFAVANTLIENFTTPKMVDLFTPGKSRGAPNYVDENRKRVSFGIVDLKVILLLAYLVDVNKGNETIDTYIRKLPDVYKYGQNVASPCVFDLDLSKVAKAFYGKRIGQKQVELVRKSFYKLHNTFVETKEDLPCGVPSAPKARKSVERTPLLRFIERELEDEKGEPIKNHFLVTPGDSFLYELTTEGGFQLSPASILYLMNEYGENTELFAVLFMLLLRVAGTHRAQAEKKGEIKRLELKKDKRDSKDITEEVAKYRKEVLTYRELTSNILQRLPRNAYTQTKNGKDYLRRELLTKDLKNATEALKKIGIISDFYTSQGATGELCNFVINPYWLVEQKEQTKALQ